MRQSRFTLAAVVLLTITIGLLPAPAQVLYGTIVGTVEDSSRAVIAGATVTVINTGNGQSREGRTNTVGEYSFPDLSQGQYTIKVTAPGFRSVTSTNATVSINTVTRVDVQLQVGDITETVTVGAEAAPILRMTQVSRAVPMSFSVVGPRGITATVSLNRERATAERSGATTLSNSRSTAADLAFSFRPPQEVVPLRSDVRTALHFLSAVTSTCARNANLPQCTSIADSRRTEYNLTMDTDMPPSVSAGLAIGYVLNDDRYVNRKFSQFTMTVSVRVFLAAGEVH